MRKVKFKNMKELYLGESEALKPKVKSVVKGSFCSEGLADEAACIDSLNMGSVNSEKGFGRAQFSSSKLGLKQESGTCIVCAPSWSACVHSEQMASMLTKSNGFSGKACLKEDNNRCSFSNADLLSPSVKGSCNDRHHTSSETSHPLSACLNRESFENDCGSLKSPIFNYKVVSNQLENQEESECLGDNISFICGSDYRKTRPNARNSYADKKNTSYNLASVDSFSETENAVNGQRAYCYLVGSAEVDDNHPRRSNRSSNESSQEILCYSNKSEFSEISSLGDSCAGATSAKVEQSECSEDLVQSSFARENALQRIQIVDEHKFAQHMQVDTVINESERTAEFKSTTVVKEVNKEDTTIGSRLAACSDGSDCSEYEVKVCDICGDIGREESLAVCSECNDGAEHIYCMRVKMDIVPKGDWLCEECMVRKENEKQKQDKLERGVSIFKKSYSLESETKGLGFEKRKEHKVGSTSLYSSKRPAGILQAVRKRPFETVLKSPNTLSSISKTSMHQSGDHSSSTVKTVSSPTKSSRKSPKLSSQSLVSRGLLFKSKEDVQRLNEGSFHSEGFSKETAASETKGRVQMMSKSMSLKNMRSYSMNSSNHEGIFPPNISSSEDLKRSRHTKGQHSTQKQKKLRLANSDLLAPMADKRIGSPCKNSLPQPSTPMAVKGHEILDNSLKYGHSSQGDSPNEETKSRQCEAACEYHTEVVPSITTKHSNDNVHSDEWPYLRDSSMFDSEVHMPPRISAVPERDYIWQGKFEIQRSSGLPFTCDRMQAHLSTYVSRKVHEVVHKLPQKLLLEEAPRLNMWPTQFMKSPPTEDDIALYFFAEDIDSYERSYKNLLDRMVKNDLSLKENFGEIDLLIFSSNQLPEKSQRWNNLLFLWGVFKGKSIHCSAHLDVSASDNFLPLERSIQSISPSLVSLDTPQTLNSNTLLVSKAATSGRMVEVCETKASSWEPKHPDLRTSSSQQVGMVELSERKESESKRIHDFDLNHSLQDSQDYAADCTEADGRHHYKRLNSFDSVMNIGYNSSNDINERRSVAINGKGPSISGELKCNGAYDVSIVSPQLDSELNIYRWKSLQQQVLSNDGRRDSSVSSLELKLGVEGSTSGQGDIPPSVMLMGSEDDTNPSLALSLAPPYSKTGGRVSKLDSELKLPQVP